jgi:hypothetical protein
LITCARRELNQRKRVYSRLVNNGKMSKESAEREIAMMAAIVANLANQIKDRLL